MKVKAIKVGFFGKLRKVDEVFDINNKKQLGSWMKLESKAKKKPEDEGEPGTEEEV